MATEEEQTMQYLKKVMLLMVIVILLVLSATFALYRHPEPAKDCSRPYDYPICFIGHTANIDPPAKTSMLVFTFLVMVLAAIALVRTSYHASVVEQKEIVTAVSHMTKGVVPPTAQPSKGIDPKTLK